MPSEITLILDIVDEDVAIFKGERYTLAMPKEMWATSYPTQVYVAIRDRTDR